MIEYLLNTLSQISYRGLEKFRSLKGDKICINSFNYQWFNF
ncbi:hypothetical protein F0Z19_2495 [Vibrio cyclitrophicus]|nr:hypothetical protein F0Z19_2495 [Vibrio cyclitrophicus]